MILPQSLEDYRQNAFLTVDEFAARLGVSTGTYYRLLKGTADITTRRRVAARLGVPPAVVAEFLPNPSQAYLEALHAAVERANQTGWLEADPETGLPTGALVPDTLPLSETVDEPTP
jgi:transcriptional regulator with XRE-family HTH domain